MRRRPRDPGVFWPRPQSTTIPKTFSMGHQGILRGLDTSMHESDVPVGELLRRRDDQGFWRVARPRKSRTKTGITRRRLGRRSMTASFAFPPMQLAAFGRSWSDWQAAGSVTKSVVIAGSAYWHPDASQRRQRRFRCGRRSKRRKSKRAVAVYKKKLGPGARPPDLYHIFPRRTANIGTALNTSTRRRRRAWRNLSSPRRNGHHERQAPRFGPKLCIA